VPKIYHITHVRNLEPILSSGLLWSDAKRIEKQLECEVVGMSKIKQRRLALPVSCHPETFVGQYVPFYFCARSIMLYILHMGNHPDVDYKEGQKPIVHLQADVDAVVAWADREGVKWAFSDRNAGTYLAEFFKSVADLDKVNWKAVAATDFRDAQIKEGKQAEFLVFEAFPWNLVEKIGVINAAAQAEVERTLSASEHRPPVTTERSWYY
jgi:hypothetical protein